MKRVLLVIFFISFVVMCFSQKALTVGVKSDSKRAVKIFGKILDKENGEPLIGATMYLPSLKNGVSTDVAGEFIFKLRQGEYEIIVSMIGYESAQFSLTVKGEGKLVLNLRQSSVKLGEVTIRGERPDENVKSTDMGKSLLKVALIEALPAFVGEVDILKAITLLPGVSTVGEASSGFHVRGGGSDQNLILLGGAPLYNPSHLFGFFSSFNADAVSNVTLYKGGIPASYGERGSSVLDIKFKEGNYEKWGGKASLGLISAKLMLEGPIVKDKLSLIIAGRSSYSDWILDKIKDPTIANSSASFYDANVILNYRIGEKNKISYSFYHSKDRFRLASDTSFNWATTNHVLDWNYSSGEKFSFYLSAMRGTYGFSILDDNSFNDFELISGIENNTIKLKADVKLGVNNFLNFGAQSTLLVLKPGELTPISSKSLVNPIKVQEEKGLESAAFVENKWDLGDKFSLSLGIRFSSFVYLGEKRVYEYERFIPRTKESVIGSKDYGDFEKITSFSGWEPRLSFRWSVSPTSSIKLGYNKVHQYIHLISNTSTIAPTDLWKLTDTFIKPEIVTQYSIGYFKNLKDNSIETSIEAYYKEIDNVVAYKDGADLVLNDQIETALLNGEGRTYGVELYIKKKTGKITGWVSYTYSRSLVKVEGPYRVEEISNGNWFSSNFDKPHDFTATLVYKLNNSWSMSSNFTYSTGRPYTTASDKFLYEGFTLAYYNERNNERVLDYHRLDFSITFKSRNKRKIWGGDWTFSVYNVYARKNAFSVFLDDVEGAPPQPYKLSVLGVPFPSLNYTIKF